MKINHVFYSSCLAAALTIGGMLHASAASYLWGNTNYPMIGTTADMPDTGLYLDINSAAVKEDTADRVDVAAIILNVVQGQVSEKKVVRFRLADNQKNYVLDSRDHWMMLPDSEDNPFSQAAVLLRQKVGHSTHKQTVTYLWNNTNYPMISDTSDLQDTGVYMDINSATVKDISDDGIQDHAQNHKEQDGKQDAEQQIKSSEKHLTPPKFLPAVPLRPPKRIPLQGCSL